jgi:segregation and condensation protein A
MTQQEPFEDKRPEMPDGGGLMLDIDGFEGPIDMLLSLARDQKVDLTRISILQLADQYLDFVGRAGRVSLELAADYLVMAAWLAYLKSRLLLPQPEDDDEPSGEELAAALTLQLRRLEAMQDAAVRLMARPQLGREVFARGAPEGIRMINRPIHELSLYELLRGYADHQRRSHPVGLTIEPSEMYSVEDALARLRDLLGRIPDWQTLWTFLPQELQSGLMMRSALASTFTASLELARSGRLRIRQDTTFGPIFVRRNEPGQ